MFSTVTSRGYRVKLMADGLAQVDGRCVTDFDCAFCGGDVGRHTGEFCRHQDAMFEAVELMDEADDRETVKGLLAGMR